jgi:hypothetical protein
MGTPDEIYRCPEERVMTRLYSIFHELNRGNFEEFFFIRFVALWH